jgi:hypothetical protein
VVLSSGVRRAAVLYALRPGSVEDNLEEPWDEARFLRTAYLAEIAALALDER